MAPKQQGLKNTKSNDGEPKKTREVLTLQQKLQVLEHLQTMSVAQVARKWNKNESSIRAIKQRKPEIFRNICDSPSVARMVFQVRDKMLVKTESALKDWLEGIRMKNYSSVDGNSVREKARSLYEYYSECNKEGDLKKKGFKASEGWLQSFIKRYDLKNLQITTRRPASSADSSTETTATELFPEEPPKKVTEHLLEESVNTQPRIEENLKEFLNDPDQEKTPKSSTQEEDMNEEEFEEDEEEEEEPEARPSYWTLENLTSVFEQAQMLKDMIMSYDPSMERSILITRAITADLDPLRHLFDEAAASYDHHFYQEMYDSEF